MDGRDNFMALGGNSYYSPITTATFRFSHRFRDVQLSLYNKKTKTILVIFSKRLDHLTLVTIFLFNGTCQLYYHNDFRG